MQSYYLITIPIAAGLIAQAIKLATDKIKGNFTLFNLTDYGGMPSAHSALVSALVTEIALIEGITSPLFAVSLIFSILIIRDALGLRNYVGKANKIINSLNTENKEFKLSERVGHTPLEIIVGCLIGITAAVIMLTFI